MVTENRVGRCLTPGTKQETIVGDGRAGEGRAAGSEEGLGPPLSIPPDADRREGGESRTCHLISILVPQIVSQA